MNKFGFNSTFIPLIMKCVSSVQFVVRVNGELLPFSPIQKLPARRPHVTISISSVCPEGFTTLLNNFGGVYVDKGI